jgi:DNA-binding beta-propeller fold protein YncE
MTAARGARTALVLAVAVATFGGATPKTPRLHLATGTIAAARFPYLPGSVLPVRVTGISAPYHVGVVGPGELLPGGVFELPLAARPGVSLLIAGNASGLAVTRLRIGAPPRSDRPLLLVASYDDGLVVHDARSFSVVGVLATGGVPSDVVVDRRGRVAVTDTQGSQLTLASLSPWGIARIDGVPSGDEVQLDETARTIFVTNREWNGTGALTRIDSSGDVTRVATGDTAEGLAVDERRQIVYVANANDGTIAFVDARSMRVVRRFSAGERVFSLALSPDGTRLYAVCNQSASSPFGKPGRAIAISLSGAAPQIVARSGSLTFPLGAALDVQTGTLFVSDEERSEIDVLDAQTLRPKRAALATCSIPWKPTLDPRTERLYVPCAGGDDIDVFNTRTLDRVARAPFATGGYPLAVAVWSP